MRMKIIVFLVFVVCMVMRGTGATVENCPVLPADNIWNTPIDTLPVHSNSNLYINTIGADTAFHPDFGSGTWNGGPIGIPFITVGNSQPMVAVTFDYDDESDPGPYPIPPDAPIEGGSGSTGDRHVLVIDRDNCILYELYYAFPQPNGSWHAGSGAIFDLNSNALRPDSWTSADAAGLPIFPGLIRYEEILEGEINHAIRFTAPQTRRAYVWPARHYASSLTGVQYPPMGQRFRLKAGFDISGYSPEVQIILTAMKKYGIILADNGSSWFISGAPDERWDNDILRELKTVYGSDMEAVDVSSLMIDPDSGQAVQPYASLSVLSPNGGESLPIGSLYDITWETVSVTNPVKITLWQNGSLVGKIADNVDFASGSYAWTVGDYIGGTVSPAAGYVVKIKEKGKAVSDACDSGFTIAPPPSLGVTSPNGGEVLGYGRAHDITWEAVSLSNPVKITLWRNGSLVGRIADKVMSSPYSWVVGSHSGGSVSPGGGYVVKIKEKGSAVSDFSDSSFSIVLPLVHVVAPDGGESWSIGSSREITWDAPGVTGGVKITLWRDGVKVGVIANITDASIGSYSWVVGDYVGGTAVVGTGYRVKIKETGTAVSDWGDGVFTLTAPQRGVPLYTALGSD